MQHATRRVIALPGILLPPDALRDLCIEDQALIKHIYRILYEYTLKDEAKPPEGQPAVKPYVEVFVDPDNECMGVDCYYPAYVARISSVLTNTLAMFGHTGAAYRYGLKDVAFVSRWDEEQEGEMRGVSVRVPTFRAGTVIKVDHTWMIDEVQMLVNPISTIAATPDGIGIHRHANGVSELSNNKSPKVYKKQQREREREIALRKRSAENAGLDGSRKAVTVVTHAKQPRRDGDVAVTASALAFEGVEDDDDDSMDI